MEESNKVNNEYDIIALGVNPDNKTIKVHVPIKEEQRNELANSLAQIAQKHGMEDYEVIVRAIRDGYPLGQDVTSDKVYELRKQSSID
ncbi:hypothetical protein [Peribacillus sp. YIM B13482]|uniref:hypothetical protein n=1 Tax=Peribacillus sp. YIM B13482 TaxID=3366298 RepID=UPI003671F4B3